ncbi:MAG: hypothetical protein II933_05305 [Candidatus Methanomethylophilaceae archaeon]|nr:hypothetical protein [Candidatus Methanomethylophilaceae archaeon]
MEMTMQYCPYCGGDVEGGEGLHDVCSSCGKKLYRFRSDFERFPETVGKVEKFSPVIAMMKDDNLQRALDTVREMIEADGGEDPDEILLLGCIYMRMREDGKAFIEWKNAVEKLQTFQNIDGYVCMMSYMISDHIYYTETEFVVFDYIKYIDRLGEAIYGIMGEPCTYVLYLTINRIFRQKIVSEGIEVIDSDLTEVLLRLFCRIIEYNRNCRNVDYLVSSMLNFLGYEEETYVEDENLVCHALDLFRNYVNAYLEELSEDDVDKIRYHWNDESSKKLVALFEDMLEKASSSGVGALGLLKSKKEGFDLAAAVNSYVRKYLLIEDSSEESEPA